MKATCLATISFAFTWGSKCSCIDPMPLQNHLFQFPHAGNFHGQRLLLADFFLHTARDGDYGHPIVCGRSSHVLFLMSLFLKAYSLYLFADGSLMGFSGGKVSVVCWCFRLIRIVKLERVGWSLVAQELFHKYQNPPPSSLNILQLHQWLYHIKDSWDIPVSHLIPRWYRFHVALEPPC